MKKIGYGFAVMGLLLSLATSATAGLSIGIGLPNVSIGINVPLFPELVPVPGYPVYYAPGVAGNYFFYDGMYWVYQNDNWYASSWYNGPWGFVDPTVVPLFVLRVPVGYYRQPPMYFRGWQANASPRWGEHWGRSWEQRRGGWDHWKRGSAPALAPIPAYQRQYAGDRYPRGEQQKVLRGQQYRYQPRDKVVRQHFKQVAQQAPAAQRGRQEAPQGRSPQRQEMQRSAPQQQGQPQHEQQRNQPQHEQRQQQQPAQREQQAPQGHEQQQRGHEQGQQESGGRQGHDGGHGQGQGREEGRGR